MKNRPQSALKVNEGIPQPPSISWESVEQFKSKRLKNLTAEQYVEGILSGNRVLLSRAITLIESNVPEHYQLSQKIIQLCLPSTGNSIRIGITGVPGVGKSSFIETFGMYLAEKGRKIAVLAIDPSSERSKGSILGDKTRMERLSSHSNAFIRPSPSSGSLGGVAHKTRETIYLCEAAGFDTIIVETVGVGQSEIAVHSMVDFFLLLALAGAGDELQGIKRGIIEMADSIVITKSDGSNVDKAMKAKTELQNALHLFPLPESKWKPVVLTCSAHNHTGIQEIWDVIQQYVAQTTTNEYFIKNRKEQAKYWLYQTLQEMLLQTFYQNSDIENRLKQFEKDVVNGKISSFDAVQQLINLYKGER